MKMKKKRNYDFDDEDMNIQEMPPRRRKKKRRGNGFVTLLVVLGALGIAIFLSFIAISGANDLLAFGKTDNQIEVTVENGMSVREIAAMLGEKGVIEQPITFRLYARLRSNENGYQAGDYTLNSNMSYDRIISTLSAGDTNREEVTVTFYEGMSLREIANKLEENKVCDADEFISCLETGEFDYEFINMLPENELRFRTLEGYLFPDTYNFFVGDNVNSVARKFLRNFYTRVFPELYDEIRDAGMTLDEAITLASIIQEEASDEAQMAYVSSVFHNRMNDSAAGLPMLQSDVTIFYVEDDIKPFQTRSNQSMYDAYNTYVCHGLPVGPICSPGVAAIRAAIKPEKTDYYFFVTDVNGKYYYSSTLREHERNVRIAADAGGTEHGTNVQ